MACPAPCAAPRAECGDALCRRAAATFSPSTSLEGEIACDDFVVEATGQARSYAACLTRVVELSGGVRASLAAVAATEERSHLGRRVEMLLDRRHHTGTRLLKARLAAIAGALMALAWIAAKTPLRVVQAMPQGAATSSVSEWMAARAVRLETPQYGHGFADMQPLKKIVGNARIVSLGEATHGTREFFQLKHRMLEFLASEMGFTLFSIEANMPEAYRLNDYVLTGRGDPARLLKGMYFWTWNTQEVLDMILWMREFNKSGRGRVEFTGFDMQTPTVALETVRDFAIKADPEYAAALRQASAQARDATSKGSAFGGATASFPVKPAAGKRARFSGYIKTERVTNGYAGLWWRVDGASGVLAFANLENRAPVGTTDWKRYELEIPIAADARNINFGALLSGDGTAWFDSLAVELDGVPYKDESAFDFDFESPSLKGFFSYGDGYRVRLDSDVVRSGKQSLQVKHVPAPQGESKPVDAGAAASTWKEVVRHFETGREAYRKKDLTAQEIEWAIQNARVVLQCLQMKANEVSRDRSMADNVAWILDQSPKAKIVLWAHNGHVSTAGYRGYEPMGASLRKMYGEQMVVFGFAFNQGSFQAIRQGKGLMDFTVPPAPAGSLDAMLAATGIPVLALDLRQAPESGPVAAWLSEPHKARSIGAVYSEDNPSGYMSDLTAPKSFDALLFVEKTTAARKNAERTP
jgi:erythromycin esterase-like protein